MLQEMHELTIHDFQAKMARPEIGRMATVLIALCAVIATTVATPEIAFPFNSQVPTVARVGSSYLFQFSSSTFAPDSTNFTYSLSDQPTWLGLNGATRTLSGTPTKSDVGTVNFTLSAADTSGAAHMPCTLVVSSDPAPQVEGDISKELAAFANLSSSQPPVVTLLPSETFQFDFQQGSFIDIVQRELYYYATLTDHTPLPSWLSFDSSKLIFSGTAPVLSGFPQSWDVDLIASDVAGFAGTTTSFTISIGTEQLTFVPAEQSLNISSGMKVSFTELGSELYLNGQSLSLQNISSAYTTSLPSWLQFDNETLAVTGTVPSNASDETFSVTVKDKAGDSATVTIDLVSGNASLILGSIGALTAYTGQVFDYRFPDSLFADNDTEVSVDLPTSAIWLTFDESTRELQGTVPSQPSATSITAKLIAKSTASDLTQTQAFTIDIKATSSSTTLSTLTTSRLSTRASATNSSTPAALTNNAASPAHLSAGVIAAIVVLSLIAAVLLIVCLLLCLRRRKRDGYELHSATPVKKKVIGRPIPSPPNVENAVIENDIERDAEKAEEVTVPLPPPKEVDPPPQIALDLPPRTSGNRGSRWLKRFSLISPASSPAIGHDANKPDTDIPDWGSPSVSVHRPQENSYGPLAELAHSPSLDPHGSPSELAMRRLSERKSRLGVGLGLGAIGENSLAQHSSKRSRKQKRRLSSLGFSVDRGSKNSLSTRGTSVLSSRLSPRLSPRLSFRPSPRASPRPSDFPAPPSRSRSTLTMSWSKPQVDLTEAQKLNSIRLVNRSDSIADNRPLEDKRMSFIKKRASTHLPSPLFTRESRASSRHGNSNSNGSVPPSSAGSARHSRGAKRMLGSYSESSSLEPQDRSSRRLSARLRSAFPPNFPRPVTASTMGADDEGADDDDSSWSYTDSSSTTEDLRRQMHLPRHQRSWVLPGEASPTPPPVPPPSRRPTVRDSEPSGEYLGPRQQWKDRMMKQRSSSPLATAVAVPLTHSNSVRLANQKRKGRLSDPMGLVDADSLTRTKPERPKLSQTKSKRPVSVDEVKRLSSLRAETGTETDTEAGSEMWEDLDTKLDSDGAGLMPRPLNSSRTNTQRSNMSGPAFL